MQSSVKSFPDGEGISLGGPWPLFGGLGQPALMWVPCPGQAAPRICFPLALDGPVEKFQSQSLG